MGGFQKFVVIVGRILLSSIFLISAVSKIVDWHGSEEALIQAMNHTLSFYQGVEWINTLTTVLIPWTAVILVVALVFELVGGILIFFGVRVRFGAVLLLLFMIPITFFFHSFWTFPEAEYHQQMSIFLKNVSIFGALLLVLAYGGCHSGHHCPSRLGIEKPE